MVVPRLFSFPWLGRSGNMRHPRHMGFQYSPNPNCPFKDHLDDGDTHCYSYFDDNSGYDVLAENVSGHAGWLADIGGVEFDDIVPTSTPDLLLPPYIPALPKGGSKALLAGNQPPIVAVFLCDIVSAKLHRYPTSLKERFGLSGDTKIILFAYGKDQLIEDLWPKRDDFYDQVQRLGFDLVTGINYSVWHTQPHEERLVNVKRSLITFSEMQKRGIPAIPHIYWSGEKDLARWADWLNHYPFVGIVAVDLQTEKKLKGWNEAVDELALYLLPKLDHDVRFIITGPSRSKKIRRLTTLLGGSLTVSNKDVAISSLAHQDLRIDGNSHDRYIPISSAIHFRSNLKFFSALI